MKNNKGNGSSSRTKWFREARFGLFIHWGLYSLAARHEWVKNKEKISNEEYQKYFDHFNPDLYNPKEWAKEAKNAGMKYFVITTKHHEGFCLWDSKYTDYKATNTPCGKDLLKPMVEAFREEGLKVGFYYSLLDWHHPHYTVDRCHPMRDNEEERKKNANRDIKKYTEYLHNQVHELLTQFGQIDIIWFDFSFPGEDGKGRKDWDSENLVKLVRKLQPDIMIDNRLDLPGVGDFETPEQFQPPSPLKDENGNIKVWEACQTFSGSWGYYRDEYSWREKEELLTTLIDCVSKGGNLLLNVGPTARGEFDERAKDRLRFFGDWMKRHSRSIYSCTAAPADFTVPPGCKLTYNPEKEILYIHILSWPYKFLFADGKSYFERVEYAQFLHDGSEIKIKDIDEWHLSQFPDSKNLFSFSLPQKKPDVAIPVIEVFLKKSK
ncbi:MAG TPA: alpha-L-fucosidase [Victivallales bacterium]|mgnify:FL=1|nr:alpha-L-fucosidase [Victivallales bacterium]HPO91025.1 alpha-L-fucosidase [Victivallales bacterium]HRU01847.1 alpha-L-fucosidase [Victivallales bacterium]